MEGRQGVYWKGILDQGFTSTGPLKSGFLDVRSFCGIQRHCLATCEFDWQIAIPKSNVSQSFSPHGNNLWYVFPPILDTAMLFKPDKCCNLRLCFGISPWQSEALSDEHVMMKWWFLQSMIILWSFCPHELSHKNSMWELWQRCLCLFNLSTYLPRKFDLLGWRQAVTALHVCIFFT